jgi:two-component system, OmpR family, phosphate regulon response regulator PhoB
MGEAVLVVENEEPARDFLSRQLADDGFDVIAADRAATALALVEERRPDLVLLDAVLPDASGFEVCGLLRAGEPGRAWDRDVPVIMVSARGDPSDRVRGFALGADDYVIRPFVSSVRSHGVRTWSRSGEPQEPGADCAERTTCCGAS